MSLNTKKKPIIERIIQLRVEHFGKRGKSDFARKLGISPSTYNYYEQDRVPPIDILLKISQVVGVELEWLIAGRKIFANTSNNSCSYKSASDIGRAVEALVAENPKLYSSIFAFIEIICEKNNIRNPLVSCHDFRKETLCLMSTDTKSEVGLQSVQNEDIKNKINDAAMIPILGRTAAGTVHCWDQCAEPDSWHAETKLSELVKKYIGKDIVCSDNCEIEFDRGTEKLAGELNGNTYIVQISGNDEGVVEFVDNCEMVKKYPDCFGLRVDGSSMHPVICDGDIVILSPSVRARQGEIAVVKVRDQIGVTCKIIRFDNGQVHLIAGNNNYETRVIGHDQLVWAIAVLAHVKRR